MKQMIIGMVFAGGLALGSSAATYNLDQAHTYLGFAVKHMVVSTTKGQFTDFSGTIDFDQDNPSAMTASATIQVASIDTDNEKRDDHLRSGDFFDAETYPTITFESTGVEGEGSDLTLKGNLTIRDVTKEIAIPVTINGPISDPWGNTRIGLEGETEVNRKDFGITWSKTMDGGGLVVADTVKIVLSVEAIQQ